MPEVSVKFHDMLAFVTSIRAKALAKDWAHIVWLLEQSLKSLVNQTSPDWRAYVVCHDVPEFSTRGDERIRWITTDIPLPERTFEDMTTDKAIKCTLGIEAALKEGAGHVMLVDADDLVHCELAATVAGSSQCPGWFFPLGYYHYYGSMWVRPETSFHRFCGTSHIVRGDLISFAPDPALRGARMASLLTVGHPQVRDHFERAGTPLLPLPYPGAVYIQHGDSAVAIRHEKMNPPTMRARIGAMRHYLLRWFNSSRLTKGLRLDFSIPDRREVPARWRSPCWRI
jgi:hypothetical protein